MQRAISTTTIRALASDVRVRWLAIALAAAPFIGLAISAVSPPSIPPVPLAAEPLYARGARAKPTLTLALSVEFPTVGAQYVSTPGADEDASYAPATEYIGYFDAESCYSYNNDPSAALRRFDRIGDAARDADHHSLRTCNGTGFSGNFMNWASSSAIDILRFGLTGGDRVVDTASLTVLQRAYLPTTSPNNYTNFWNGTNFPAKHITNAVAVGALPSTLLGTHTGEYLGVAATGRAISVEQCEVYEFDADVGGRVTNTWSYGDPSALFSQLGVVPGAGAWGVSDEIPGRHPAG